MIWKSKESADRAQSWKLKETPLSNYKKINIYNNINKYIKHILNNTYYITSSKTIMTLLCKIIHFFI